MAASQNEQQTQVQNKDKKKQSPHAPQESSFSFTKLDLKYKLLIICSISILFYLAYSISIYISIVLLTILLSSCSFIWFSNTDLSVEITVFLAKFFPASEYTYIDCKNDMKNCGWTKAFRDNYKIIHNELLEFLQKYNYCPQMDDVYPNGSITNWDRKWPTVNLRCYGIDTKISKYFPKTMQLVNNSDTWLSHVMFSILKPNKFIPRHRGPYRGVFRYQLSLEIPPYTDHSKELYLAVWENTSSEAFWSPENVPEGDPILVKWTNGSDFLFDDTCVHEVINFTGKRRIILFADAERFDLSFFSRCIHKFFMNLARFLPAVKLMVAVQDDYLKNCIDDKTKKPTRFKPTNTQADINDQFNLSNLSNLSNRWMWYNTAPEILPYKRARVVIQNKKTKK